MTDLSSMSRGMYDVKAARSRPKNPPTIVTHKTMGAHGKYLAKCGTDAGYQRHINDKEETCVPCRIAHAKKRAKVKGTKYSGRVAGMKPHGSWSGLKAHRKKGERLCPECADFQYAESQKYKPNKVEYTLRYALEQRLCDGAFLIKTKAWIPADRKHKASRPVIRDHIMQAIQNDEIPEMDEPHGEK